MVLTWGWAEIRTHLWESWLGLWCIVSVHHITSHFLDCFHCYHGFIKVSLNVVLDKLIFFWCISWSFWLKIQFNNRISKIFLPITLFSSSLSSFSPSPAYSCLTKVTEQHMIVACCVLWWFECVCNYQPNPYSLLYLWPSVILLVSSMTLRQKNWFIGAMEATEKLRESAAKYGIKPSTTSNLWTKYKNMGTTKNLPHSGHPPKLLNHGWWLVVWNCVNECKKPFQQITHDTMMNISEHTVHDVAADAGYHQRVVRKVPHKYWWPCPTNTERPDYTNRPWLMVPADGPMGKLTPLKVDRPLIFF